MNRISIIVIALLTRSLPLFPQTSPDSDASFVSGDQKLVRMAVDSSLCILRQEYTLSNRSGSEYGRNGKDYFGKTYTIGVLAGKKVWTDSRLLRPWEGDGNYDRFRSIDSIKPRLSGTFARQLVRSGYTAVKEDSSSRGTDSGLAVLQSPDPLLNIALVGDCRDRGGWLVVAAGRDGFPANDTLPVSYTIYKAQPQFSASDNKGYLKNMPVRENIIGGVYFISNISLGAITFSAAGILEKDKRGWYVQLFPAPGEHKRTEDLTPLKK